MPSNRELRALDIFEQALDLPAERIKDFVSEACGDDADLQAAVDSLFTSLGNAGNFLPSPDATAITQVGLGDNTPSRSTSEEFRIPPGFLLQDRYAIVESLGAGGMGEVYRAIDSRLDREVAIKVLNLACHGDDSMHERFEREIKSIAALTHANIVTLHDVLDHDDATFAVMEYVQGGTIKDCIEGRLEFATVVELAHEIASGLSAAHAQNIMHRDMKPANIMVTADGHGTAC